MLISAFLALVLACSILLHACLICSKFFVPLVGETENSCEHLSGVYSTWFGDSFGSLLCEGVSMVVVCKVVGEEDLASRGRHDCLIFTLHICTFHLFWSTSTERGDEGIEWKDILLVIGEGEGICLGVVGHTCTSATISFVRAGISQGRNLVGRPDTESFWGRGLDHSQLDTLHICNPSLCSQFQFLRVWQSRPN